MRDRVNLLDTWVDRVSLGEAGERILSFIRAGTPHQIVTANVDFLRLGVKDPTFRELVNRADLVVPDGMPLIWASQLLGAALPLRIAGVDLILEMARLLVGRGGSMFLLGAAAGVADEAAAILQHRFPGLRIAGTYAPPLQPLTSDEEAAMVRLIREAQPDILLVAFGAPRQERWIREHMAQLGVPVCMGVGGAFDMLAGRVKRAPVWMQGHGLEWLFRVLQEPRRLWRRYLVHDLPVFLRLMAQSWSNGSTPRPSPELKEDLGAPYTAMSLRSLDAYALEESDSGIPA